MATEHDETESTAPAPVEALHRLQAVVGEAVAPAFAAGTAHIAQAVENLAGSVDVVAHALQTLVHGPADTSPRLHPEESADPQNVAEPDDFLPISEVARQVGVTRASVRAQVHAGKLPSRKEADRWLVSLGAARALAGKPALAAAAAAGYVPPSVAAQAVGLPMKRVISWSSTGKVASRPGPYGQLVRLADVQALAEQQVPSETDGEAGTTL